MSTVIIITLSPSNTPPRFYRYSGFSDAGLLKIVDGIIEMLGGSVHAVPIEIVRQATYARIDLSSKGGDELPIRFLDHNDNLVDFPIKLLDGSSLQSALDITRILNDIRLPPDSTSYHPRADEKIEVSGIPNQSMNAKVSVYIQDKAKQRAWEHARDNSNREVGGVLIGRFRKTPERVPGFLVLIEDVIVATAAIEEAARLTFTADTWKAANEVLDQIDPGRVEYKMVGWYHTHPGYGIFLSQQDLFWHESFFREPYHLAWVIDPHSGKEGMFGWVESKVVKLPEPQTPEQALLDKFNETNGNETYKSNTATQGANVSSTLKQTDSAPKSATKKSDEGTRDSSVHKAKV